MPQTMKGELWIVVRWFQIMGLEKRPSNRVSSFPHTHCFLITKLAKGGSQDGFAILLAIMGVLLTTSRELTPLVRRQLGVPPHISCPRKHDSPLLG